MRGWMEARRQDLRHAIRGLRRNPGFAAAAILTLGLGIGATTGIVTAFDQVVLRPLPFAEAGRVLRLFGNFPGTGLVEMSLSPGEFVDVQEGIDALESVAGYIPGSVNLTGAGEPERLSAAWSTPGLFRTLGVEAAVGRTFREGDGEEEGEAVVLGHGFWQRRFGAAPSVLGRSLTLNGRPFTVVGVAPPAVDLPQGTDLWLAFPLPPSLLAPSERGSRFLRAVGRLAPGATLEGLQAELDLLVPRFREAHPDLYSETEYRFSAVLLRDRLLGDARPTLALLVGAVGLVLLIACANLAGLGLARLASRRRDLAVHMALGAGRLRLGGQVVLEALVLASLGSLLGLALAGWALGPVLALAPAEVPRLDGVRLDLRSGLLALGLAVLAGLATGIVPALQAGGARLAGALGSGGRGGTAGPSGARARSALVVGQLALALALLGGAGLLVRSLVHLQAEDPGLAPRGLLTARLSLPPSGYGDPDRVAVFFGDLTQELGTAPGVRDAAAISALPLTGGAWDLSFGFADRAGGPSPDLSAEYRAVTPGYFDTAGIPLLAGRPLREADRRDAPLVAVVDEAFVGRYLRGENPLGRRLELPILGLPMESHVREIVGVVGSVRLTLDREPAPTLYVPHGQQPVGAMSLLLRTTGDPGAAVPALRDAVAGLDPDLPVYEVRGMEQVLAAAMARRRFTAWLVGGLAAVALLLSALGVYAVIAHAVRGRRREIGIRVALGATARDILGLAMRRGILLVGIGVALGLAGALAGGRLLADLLYGVGPADPATLGATAALLAGAGIAATWWPARRALRVDPVQTLREE